MVEGHQLTRRTLLASTPALIATATVLSTTASAASASWQDALIETHRQAYVAYDDACSAIMVAEERIRKLPEILAPETVYPDGTTGTLYCTHIFSADEIRAKVASRHAELRRIYCGPWAHKMASSYAGALLEELAASEQRALAGLEIALAEKAKRECATGIPDLEAVVDSTRTAEEAARLELVLYRPANAVEARAKAEYIEGSTPFREFEFWEPDFLNALIDSLGEVA
jgi:hypothetical protein